MYEEFCRQESVYAMGCFFQMDQSMKMLSKHNNNEQDLKAMLGHVLRKYVNTLSKVYTIVTDKQMNESISTNTISHLFSARGNKI